MGGDWYLVPFNSHHWAVTTKLASWGLLVFSGHHWTPRVLMMPTLLSLLVHLTHGWDSCLRQKDCHFADSMFFRLIFLYESVAFWFIFYWNWFPRVHSTIFQHLFTYWLSTEQVMAIIWTNNGIVYWCIYASLQMPYLINIGSCNGLLIVHSDAII